MAESTPLRGSSRNGYRSVPAKGVKENQPALSKVQWRTEVEKMRTAYKAPIDPKDVDTIVDYLAGLRH